MGIATGVLRSYEALAEDEFELDGMLRFAAVRAAVADVGVVLVAAVLIWALPAKYALLSCLAVVPQLVGNLVASLWYQQHHAVPAIRGRRTDVLSILGWIAALVLCCGVFRRAWLDSSPTVAIALLAFVAVWCLYKVFGQQKYASWLRKKDERRLSKQYADED